MTELAEIDVCVATFKRPQMLMTLLDSLSAQDLAGIRLRIVVIDNDREGSARAVVDIFRRNHAFEVIYDIEPQQNISLARNRAIAHVQSTYFAFIDDDESVSPHWLRTLLDSLLRYDADIVFGPVICSLPKDAPAWAEKCFLRPRQKTGELMQFGGAGNVLMKRSVVMPTHARFNSSFGLTGGEDTDFFYRQFVAGRRLIWCDEAVVTEPVAATRLTLRWIRRRGFRSGQTYQRIFVTRYTTLQKILWFMIKSAQVIGGVVVAPLMLVVSYSTYVALTVRIASASGQLSRCLSRKNFEEYNTRHYQ